MDFELGILTGFMGTFVGYLFICFNNKKIGSTITTISASLATLFAFYTDSIAIRFALLVGLITTAMILESARDVETEVKTIEGVIYLLVVLVVFTFFRDVAFQ